MSVRYAQVEFFIGEKSLVVPPNHIKGFIFEDTSAYAGDSFTLQAVDPTWDLLESDIIPSMAANAEKHVQFRYGWGGTAMSEMRYGAITEFVPAEISRAGVSLVIKGYDVGSVEANEAVPATYQGTISDVVTRIAIKNGWKYDVEPTVPIYEREGRKKGLQLKTLRKSNVTDLKFINELAQHAKSKKGTGAYRVHFDSKKNPPELHFHTSRSYKQPLYKTYVFQTDRMGEVISFTPEVQGTALVALGASFLSVLVRDPVTRKLEKVETDVRTFKEGVALGSKSPIKGGKKVRQHLPPMTRGEAEGRVHAFYESISDAAIQAQMEIVGDPFIMPDSLIQVIVRTPSGRKYFLSGLYKVGTVTHTIESGSYTCQLDLTKNAFEVGDIEITRATVGASSGMGRALFQRARNE